MSRRTSAGMERKFTGPTNNNPLGNILVMQPKPAPCKESWWIQPSREAFSAEQRRQQERMTRTAVSVPHKDAI